MNNYFNIGRIVAASGLKGELVLQHSLGKRTSLKGVNAVFLENTKDSFLPYFILQARSRNEQEILLQLEGVDTPEEARKLLQKNVYLTEEWFRKFSAASSSLSLLGFTVTDGKNNEKLGAIEEIIEMPFQVLAKVHYRQKELLLPLNEQTLRKVNKKDRTVILDIPDGLINIYFS